jgi:two-component system sensor kinase FixL
MLAHELNQPLTAILSNAQAARRYLDAEGSVTNEVKDILNDIVRDDKRASELILRHRNMIKKETIVREQISLNEVAGEVIELLDKDISSKNIKLISQLSADLPPVQAGKLEIQQVVLNFLTNAVKAVENGDSMTRKITVSTSRKNTNQVELQVQDSGPGIPEDIQQSLFNSFVTGNEDGLGLGLAICRRIIENHDGHIRADNSETGGAIFSFTLPIKL